MSYLGRSAKLSLKAQEKVSFLATAGQTSKTGLSYVPNFVEVYVNGILLTDTTDFTATNGNSVTFTVALALNDEVTVISLKTFSVADHYTISAANTLLAAKATNTAVALKAPIASPVFTGNVGVGVVPEDWRANDFIATQVGSGAAVYGRGSGDEDKSGLTSNAYYDSTNDRWQYISTKAATNYYQNSGNHTFYVAPSGTADAAISWTTGFEVLNDGKARAKNGLLFGTDTAAANALDDYEDGSFTPNDQAGNACTLNVTNGYTKIGSIVTFDFDVTLPAYSSGSVAYITIPFASSGNGSGCVGWNDLTTGTMNIHISLNRCYLMNSTDGNTHITASAAAGNRFIGSATYRTDA